MSDVPAQNGGLASSIFDDLDELSQRAERELVAVEERLRTIEAQRSRLQRFLKAVSGEEPKAKRRTNAKTNAKGTIGIGSESLLKVIEAILSYRDGETFTAMGIHEGLGAKWSEPHTYEIFKRLRQIEFIGKAREPGPGGRIPFHIIDRATGEKLKASLLEGQAPPTRTAVGSGISPDRARRIADAIMEEKTATGEPVTAKQIITKLGLSEGSTRDAIRALCDAGYLVEAGTRREPDASRPSAVYDIGDTEMLKELVG